MFLKNFDNDGIFRHKKCKKKDIQIIEKVKFY